MTQFSDRSASPAVAPRSLGESGGVFVAGSVRIRVPEREPVRSLVEKFAGDERERRDHIRRWARMMIVHLERTEFHAPQEDYVATLERLQELLQLEIDSINLRDDG
jgi:hypothetical protein